MSLGYVFRVLLIDQHKLQIAGTCFVLCTANQQFALSDTVDLFYHCARLLLFATLVTLILVFAKVTGVSSANQCILGNVYLRSNLSRGSEAKSGIARVALVRFFFNVDNSRLAIGLSSHCPADKAAHTSE